MSFKFEKLKVWHIALDLSNTIDKVALAFPRHELYSLSSQIKRAADSIVLNIAEGCTLQSNTEFKRFLVIANRSALEVVACLYIAQKRNYISDEIFNGLYNSYLSLVKQLQALMNSLTESKKPTSDV
jgi:four helix bundle protein